MNQLKFPVTKKEAEKQGIVFSSEKNKEALFPTRLRELRGSKGVSQSTLAKAMGVSKSTIGLYETGDTLPDAKTLHDLAIYFDVTADYMLGLSKATKPENHSFAEQTHFDPRTIDHLLQLSGIADKEDWSSVYVRIAFETFFNTIEFDQILEHLRGYLEMTMEKEKLQNYNEVYCKLDQSVRDISKNNLHVVNAPLMAETLLVMAQKTLAEAFKSAKAMVDRSGGWVRYMPPKNE